MKFLFSFVALSLFLLLPQLMAQYKGIDEPPLVTVPATTEKPVIDGHLDEPAWQRAAGITGFASFTQSALVPGDLQPQWWLCFDDENLYLASRQVIYPAGTARAAIKRGDEGGSNTEASEPSGLLSEDHVEITLSEFVDDRSRPLREYFYKWIINSYAAVVDQRAELSVGWSGFEWESDAEAKVTVTEDAWTLEMAIPWLSLGFEKAPANGQAFLAQFVNAQDSEHFYFAWVPAGWRSFEFFGTIVLQRDAPAVGFSSLGEPMDGKLDAKGWVASHGSNTESVDIEVAIEDPEGKTLLQKQERITVTSGEVKGFSLGGEFVLDSLEEVSWADGRELHQKRLYEMRTLAKREDGSVLFREEKRFIPRPKDLTQNLYDAVAASRGVSGEPAVRVAYYPSYDLVEAEVDIAILGIDAKYEEATQVEVAVERLVQETVQRQVKGTDFEYGRVSTVVGPEGTASLTIPVKPLPVGGYGIFTRLLDASGKLLFEQVVEFKKRNYEWEGNTLGITDKPVPPWASVKVNGKTISVWNRSLTFEENGLPKSIISGGDGLLSGPIHFESNGHKVEIVKPVKLTSDSPAAASTLAEVQIGKLPVTVETETEYDGLTWFRFTLHGGDDIDVNGLSLVIPLNPVDTVAMLGGSGRNPIYAGDLPDGEGILWRSSESVPAAAGIKGKFLSFAYLGNGARGLTYVNASDQGWILDDDADMILIRRQSAESGPDLVLNLIANPATLKGDRKIEFALQATPVKPMPPGYRSRLQGLHPSPKPDIVGKHIEPWDATKIRSWMSGNTYVGTPGADLLTFRDEADWEIFREEVRRMKRRDWPDYDIRHLKYVATNTLGLATPEFDTYAGEWAGHTTLKTNPTLRNFRGAYTTIDLEGRTRIIHDMPDSMVDYRVWAFDQHQEQASLDGYWWDHEQFWTSANPITGSAYINDKGEAQGILNIWQFREMYKRMAHVAHENAMPNEHGRYAQGVVPAIMSHGSYLWAVETVWYMPSLKFDQLDTVGGLDGYRAMISRWAGLPIIISSVVQDKDFDLSAGERPHQSRSVIGLALLHDVDVTDSGVHVEIARNVGQILLDFDYFDDRVEWIPYWESQSLINAQPDDVVTTLYIDKNEKTGAEALAVVFNPREDAVDVILSPKLQSVLNTSPTSAENLESGELYSDPSSVTIHLEPRDFALIRFQ